LRWRQALDLRAALPQAWVMGGLVRGAGRLQCTVLDLSGARLGDRGAAALGAVLAGSALAELRLTWVHWGAVHGPTHAPCWLRNG
jgi:hypothetical protein